MGKTLLIAGYYGFGNTGDEAILSAILSELRAQRPQLEFTVVSGNPEQTAARYKVASVLYTDLKAIIESARRCDVILLGGGGLFHDYWGFDPTTVLTREHWSISFYSTFPLLASLLNKPLMLFAIGVGPLLSDAGRQYTYFAFDQASVSTVRDLESKELLVSLGLDATRIKVTADPAYLIAPAPQERVRELLESEGLSSPDQWLIGVALRNWDIGVEPEKWTREVANALDIVIERYKAKIVFLPFQQVAWHLTDDAAISHRVCEHLRNREHTLILQKTYNANEQAGILAQCNLVFGMRLHSIIFAANAGVPVIALSYDPKVRNVMRQLGCEKYAIDLSATSAVELLRQFEEVYKNQKKITAQLEGAGSRLRSLAKENTDLTIELLENPERFQRELSSESSDFLKEVTLKLALRLESVSQKIATLEHWTDKSARSIASVEADQIPAENSAGSPSKALAQSRELLQLEAVIERVRNSKGAIIFLPSIGWNIDLFQRPHHLAREFARQGYVSIFDSSNSLDKVRGFKEIEPSLYLYHGPQEVLCHIPDPLLWAFPYNFDDKDAYPSNTRTLYDWIDDLAVFDYDQDFLLSNHRRALKEADVVTSVARGLHEEALAVRSDAVYLPNGVEYDRFATEAVTLPEDIADLRREGKPIAGYYGALAKWFDYQLLDEIAGLRPDWNFLLIGPMYDQSLNQQPMLHRENIKWIGPRSYPSLPQYLKVFDVAMIPFVINNITVATSPLKLYEYFAGGKAVITTPMPECESFKEVTIARNAEEFAKALDRAKEQGLDMKYRARVRALAHENSWTRRVQTVEELLQRKERAKNKATQMSEPENRHPRALDRQVAVSQGEFGGGSDER
jgi:polysaccharide pyruvyl transferase CsaB